LRVRFSLCTLFIALTAFGVVLGLSLRFGPHVVWKTLNSQMATGVEAIPSKPLEDQPPSEDLAVCRIGPMSFELPRSMAANVAVVRGDYLVSVRFRDGQRGLALVPPEQSDESSELRAGCPDPALVSLTSPRLYKEIYDARQPISLS
jgi:hypothetical protein